MSFLDKWKYYLFVMEIFGMEGGGFNFEAQQLTELMF
jgi:hypothetical protein